LRKPSVILVQSPPVLPTLLVGRLLSWWHRARFIVDWHNIGYTLLAQTLKSPMIIAVAKTIELYFSRITGINLVVSQAQKEWMQINAGSNSIILYDRPDPTRFKALKGSERKAFRRRIRERLGWGPEDVPLLVSSTSWTPDEDFSILVKALEIIEEGLKRPIQLLVTGKGPLKTTYEEQIVNLGLRMVQFGTVWLSYEDYAQLLGSADLGLCLHASSSGVDLPMKAIDMISAELPVVAYNYTAIGELIEDKKTGILFQSPEELADAIKNFLNGRLNCTTPNLETWSDQWNRVVGPILL
jgi:beta-1,4-mannosyltransferase